MGEAEGYGLQRQGLGETAPPPPTSHGACSHLQPSLLLGDCREPWKPHLLRGQKIRGSRDAGRGISHPIPLSAPQFVV